jgi:hypothetical protein
MLWPMLAVVLGFCGIALLGVLAVRVALEVRRLGRQVSLASARITRAAADLEHSATSLVSTGETWR